MRMPLFRGMRPWGAILTGVLLSSLLLAACGSPQSTLDTAGPVAGEEATLFWIILAIATIIFVAVEAALIYSIVRFRERPNAPAPRQIHGNNTIEIIWTVAPSLFLFLVLAFTIRTMFALAQPAGNKIEVRAVGHQWWWEFDYPGYNNIVTADSLHVPMGSTVQVDLVSDNVIHSLWIPPLAGKTDVIPGHNNHLWFRGDRTGEFRGACAEYCGTQHAHMNFSVIVDTQDAFNTWVSTQQQNAITPPNGSLAAKGAMLFTQQCVGCHGIVGVNLQSYTDPKAAALIGPNLTHFGSRTQIAGGVLDNDPQGKNLRTWLSDPQKVKPGNDMVVNLTPDQVDALVVYLESLK